MIARLALIGAALAVLGLLHLGGNGTLTAAGGVVLLVVAGVAGVVRHQRGLPVVQSGRWRR